MKGTIMFGKELLRCINDIEKSTNAEKKTTSAAPATKPILYLILKYNTPAKRA